MADSSASRINKGCTVESSNGCAMTSTAITTKVAEKIIDKLTACRDKWFALIDASFLTDELKEAYKALLAERLERL